jgi:hypothetical protein
MALVPRKNFSIPEQGGLPRPPLPEVRAVAGLAGRFVRTCGKVLGNIDGSR